ncbi:MAG TPA: hypothetical protein VK797_22760 [Tepidisphaeraceae bacterium]|nr:hypothetical protein [Tepidisphaeraceae bacterium]
MNIPCLECGGQGTSGFDQNGERVCPRCGGRRFEAERLTACPLDFVTPDVWEILNLLPDFKAGRYPAAGGLYDQAAIFLEAIEFVRQQEQMHKLARGAPVKIDGEEEEF